MTYVKPGFSKEWIDGALRRVEIAHRERRIDPGLSHEIVIEVLTELLKRLPQEREDVRWPS